MKLFYTGVTDFNDIQDNPSLSQGGYLSSTEIDLSSINTLFGQITQQDLAQGKVDLRVLGVLNNDESTKTLRVYYNNLSVSPISFLKMGLEAITESSCSEVSTPTQPSSLEDNRGEENYIEVEIPSSGYKTLFIQRNISKSLGLQYLSCTNLYNNFIKEDKNQVSVLTFNSNPIAGEYIKLYTQGNTYIIYYTDKPTDVTGEFIKVTPGATTALTILATYTKLLDILAERGEVTLAYDSTTLTITQSLPGPVTEPVASFATIVTTAGTTSNIEDIEDIELVLEY